MTNETHDLRVSARTCRLTAGSNDDDEDDGPPYRFGGVAVAAGDVLHMDDGTRVLMTASELRKAAETQAGEPLTKDHPEDDQGRPKYPPDLDETHGKIDRAGWVTDQEAVAYEATTHDEAIATGVQAGSFDVSVHPTFEIEEYDGDEADVVAKNIQFLDLSVVSKGDSPSATAEFGPNEALASWTAETDIGAELTAAYNETDTPDDPEGLVEKLARMFGIIGGSGDRRGGVRLVDQTSDGETIAVRRATFEDASWMACAHLQGDEYPDIGPGLGPSIGDSMPMDGGQMLNEGEIELDEPLEEDADVYVALHYAGEDGEKLDHITAADGGYFYDRAFVGVAPEGAEVTAEASDGNEAAESAVETQTDMADGNTPEDDGEQTTPDADDVEGDDSNVVEVDIGEHDSFDDYLQDQVTNAVEQVTAQSDKAEKVDKIIAKSDDYEEGDREALMASADAMVDNEYNRVRTQAAATLPGNAGGAASLIAGASDDADEYGTGVAGED